MESFDKARLLAKIKQAVASEVSDPSVGKALFASLAKEVEKHHNRPVHECACSCCYQQVVGVRYKCSICADFNLCGSCEEFVDHEHALLKIKFQGQPFKSLQLPTRAQKNAGYLKPTQNVVFIAPTAVSFRSYEQEEVKVGLPEEGCFFLLQKENA